MTVNGMIDDSPETNSRDLPCSLSSLFFLQGSYLIQAGFPHFKVLFGQNG